MSHVQLNIIIVGGGIAGLSAALALRRQDHIVTVVEASSWLREAGAAVAIAPNSSIPLMKLGIDLVRDVKCAALKTTKEYRFSNKERSPKFGEDGDGFHIPMASRLAAIGLQDFAFLAHRVDLHDALKAKCLDTKASGLPVNILLSSKVVSWDPSGSIELQDGTQMHADLIVAADGIHSTAHEVIIGREVPAVASGVTAMRFLLKTKDILSDPATASIMDDGPGCFVFYATPHRESYLLRYACHNDEVQNFAAYATKDDTGTLAGELVSKAALLERLSALPPIIQAIGQKTDDHIWDWKIADREPIESYQKDRLVLIGDAAHPLFPRMGQGASTSIEDAVSLGILMGVLSSKAEIPTRLKLYDRLRVRRTSAMQLLSRSPSVAVRPIAGAGVQSLPQEVCEVFRRFPSEEPVPRDYDDLSRWVWAHDCIAAAQSLLDAELARSRSAETSYV